MKKTNLDDDATLIAEYKGGSESAFAGLVFKHKSKIYTTIYLIVKDRYIAEDILQETFIKIVDTIKAGRYNEEGKFLPWALRIGHNLAVDYFRKDKRYTRVELNENSSFELEDEFVETDSIENLHIRKESMGHIRHLIAKLPEPQREVLLMRHFADMSFQEIAEMTGVSINTSLGRMRYALINLRKQLLKTQLQND